MAVSTVEMLQVTVHIEGRGQRVLVRLANPFIADQAQRPGNR